MKKENITKIVTWVKRILAAATVVIWISVIFEIASSPAPFAEEAPYCILSTMLIFGILSALFKGLEYYEKRMLQNEKEERKS